MSLSAKLKHELKAVTVATLFFAAMLFLPLVREVLRRLQESPSGGAF